MNPSNDIAQANSRAVAFEEIESLIECRELPAFDTEDIEAVRSAFGKAAPIALRQAWREREEFHFTPGEVRVGWRLNSFLVFAELTDVDIFNHVTGHNQHTWLQGDTFEIFLRPVEQRAYVEFHVTPNNHRLQLRYATAEAFGRVKNNGCIENVVMPGAAFRSRTWVRASIERWFVFADIPVQSVCDQKTLLNGQQWRFSFSRYDYHSGREQPILSSSSAHSGPDFHRQEEWGLMTFKPFVR